MENFITNEDKFPELNDKRNNSKKQKDGFNTSNISRDVGMNDIIDQIGNLMKKFANEVNTTKNNITQNEGK